TFIATLAVMIGWRFSYFAIVAVLSCLFVNSIMFESADVFFTLPLLIAVTAFLKGRYALFSAMFTLACFVKWQPAIAAPLLGLHFLLSNEFATGRERMKVILQRLVLPAAIVLMPMITVFGPAFLIKLPSATVAAIFFTGNTFNLDYVIGWLYGATTGML